MAKLLHLHDEDTGESRMDVVCVPEGFSFQLALNEPTGDGIDFCSIIVSHERAKTLAAFLTSERPHAPTCRWERTTEAECAFRATHLYCPHAEHACDCRSPCATRKTPLPNDA